MIKVALVKSNGEVAYTVSPAVDDMYLDGSVYDGMTARHIDHTLNDALVISTWYWDGEFKTRDAKSNDWQDWVDNAWLFNSVLFWLYVRNERNLLISASDWTQMSDNSLTNEKKTEWATYRQTLRNIPATHSAATSLENITWPTKPGA